MIKTSFLFQLSISCLSPSHFFLTFPLSSSAFWSQRLLKTNACRSIFVLQCWSVGLIPESNVYTNSTIKNDLGLSALSLHKCMLRKQIASCIDCQQVCCAFEVLIMTFHCYGVHVILYSNTYFSLYYIMTILLYTSTPVIMGFQFVWLTLILYECEYLNTTLWHLYGYVQFNNIFGQVCDFIPHLNLYD